MSDGVTRDGVRGGYRYRYSGNADWMVVPVTVEKPLDSLRHSLRIIADNKALYPSMAKPMADQNIEMYWRTVRGSEMLTDSYSILYNIGEPDLLAYYEQIAK